MGKQLFLKLKSVCPMKKSVLMAVVAVCVASAAFASFRRPAGIVRTQHAVVDTLPKDTTQLPPKTDTTTPPDTTKTDTSTVSH